MTAWHPPSGTLGELVQATAGRVRDLGSRRSELERLANASRPGPSLLRALDIPTVGVIAEVKRQSPSRGLINGALDAAAQATAYARGGAVAISVLTEATRFGGQADDLVAVRRAVQVPILRKDFIIDELQITESRALGASGVLLIARALEPKRLPELTAFARDLGVEPLVEVRDPRELERALEAGARVVGVNNRDLETLEVDRSWAARLLPQVPASVYAIAESGIESCSDVARVAHAGADAVLVGSALSSALDPAASVRQLSGVPRDRSPRGGGLAAT